jgi:DNA gyrase/topoisomerase IV subunit A
MPLSISVLYLKVTYYPGWSTSIPNYNPKDIVNNLIRIMDGEEIITMKPWYRGFKVSITLVFRRTQYDLKQYFTYREK